ncbi:MAG: enoyl-CoA hydratase/isomerase family protein [Chloroflexi bacterium]|nr:enoyl-CoA hydratase/isomerase family protein [Chloroflexota bacterium]
MDHPGGGGEDLQHWLALMPYFPEPAVASEADFTRDTRAATRFFERGGELLRRLPSKPGRGEREAAVAGQIEGALREARTRFLRAYLEPIYRSLTDDYRCSLRTEDLVYRAAERYPGLTPSREIVLAERASLQKDKEGAEIDQGLFLSQVLAHPRAGAHLVHAMLRPRPESLERLDEFQRTGVADLGKAAVERRGRAGHLLLRNLRFLNAEDDSTVDALEIGVDLILLDPSIEVGVMRGARVDHPRYRDRHVFSAGLNLTHLYHGKISYLFYITRDLGFVNKIYRGLAGPELHPGEPETTREKPWIAAVEAFAIGGGCQILLVMDRVLAEETAFFNLPARKEGIIPGTANLRLPRAVGARLARDAILFDRQFSAASPEGRLICDEVVPVGEMDAAIERAVAALTGSGLVSAAGNRRALRVGEEPRAVFQAYMATYAREQAYCHFRPALIRNLEVNWRAQERTE